MENISILQLNTNRTQASTETILDIAVSRKVDILCIQEPWIFQDRQRTPDFSNPKLISHPSFSPIFPKSPPNLRPRTLIYVARTCTAQVSLREDISDDPDVLAVDIKDQGTSFLLLNIYNEKDQGESSQHTVERRLTRVHLDQPAIVCGDFNAHHPWWDPSIETTIRAEGLVDWVDSQDLDLLNTPGTGTFYRPYLSRESVLDLTFASPGLVDRISNWEVIEGTASDHHAISFTIVSRKDTDLVDSPLLQAGFNTRKADWPKFQGKIAQLAREDTFFNSAEFTDYNATETDPLDILQNLDSRITRLLDRIASSLTDLVLNASEAAIPRSKPGARLKP